MAKHTTKELEKLIPTKIEGHGHYGNLTIMKRSNSKFLAYYPFSGYKTIETTKGKTINSCLTRMHDQLLDKGVIRERVKKKKKKSLGKKKPKALHPKERLRRKLNIQKKTVRSK